MGRIDVRRIALTLAAPALALALLLMGLKPDRLVPHLPAAADALAAGWTLVCGLAALRIATWIARWERRAETIVLCRPLRSGTMSDEYYLTPARPDAAGAPG